MPAPRPTQGTTASSRVFTVPNLISFLRLLGVPLFLYLFLGPRYDVAALIVLAVGGTSDWVDGFVARRLHQVSRVGQLLDPLVDRLYILATLLALTARGVLPWWFTVALLAREVVLGGCLLVLRAYGYGPPPVHFVGKTATFVLLASFPTLVLAAATHGTVHAAAYAAGWALALWGLGLYWVAGALYIGQVGGLVRPARAAGAT